MELTGYPVMGVNFLNPSQANFPCIHCPAQWYRWTKGLTLIAGTVN
jgi:hypothetical protein